MKKVIIFLTAMLYVMCSHAQISKVYRNGGSNPIATFTNDINNKYKVVLEEIGQEQTFEYQDLGLPSGKLWATCNVGANTPGEDGLFFAWGETVGYTSSDGHQFNATNYTLCNNDIAKLTKYCSKTQYGVKDDLSVLESINDAATQIMGEHWRIPSREEFAELFENCYCQWTNSYNGTTVSGYIIYKAKSDSDKGTNSSFGTNRPTNKYDIYDTHIFLPNNGFIQTSGVHQTSSGWYWTNTVCTTDSRDAYNIGISENRISYDLTSHNYRYNGGGIRPIYIE